MPPRAAGFALLLGGAMWGLYWIPLRFFINLGFNGAWSGIIVYGGALVVLMPFVIKERHKLTKNWRALLLSGAFTGSAFGMFSMSLAYTEVARAIILFYLTPIWGTIIGLVVLRERLTLGRISGLGAGLCGMVVILGTDGSIPLPKNTGDWLALASGVIWAFGSLGLYRSSDITVLGQVAAFLGGALLIAIFWVLLGLGGGAASFGDVKLMEIVALSLLSALYVLPMVYLTIYPATLLSPSRVGLLLMSEIVVGLASAAIFSGEPFGRTEFMGAFLIVSAGLIEIGSARATVSDAKR